MLSSALALLSVSSADARAAAPCPSLLPFLQLDNRNPHRSLMRRALGSSGINALAASGVTALAFLIGGAGGVSNQAHAAIVSACSGVSLPPSVVTGILGPVLGQLSPILNLPPLNLNNTVTAINGGAPIGLQVIDTNGNVVSNAAPCTSTADVISLDTPAGIAFGGNAITGLGNGTTASAADINAIAIGNGASTSAAALRAVAIGFTSTASGVGAVAIGSNAMANNANDVAIGAGSSTAAAVGTAGVMINGVPYVFAGAAPVSTVSIGSPGNERTIANLAAGRLSATSTDAVNGSQLFATNSAVNMIGALATNSVQYDNPAKTSVTLGGVGAPGTVALTNVGPGALTATSTDAVNGSQLFATNNAINTVSTTVNNINNGAGIKYFHANSTLGDSTAGGADSVAIGPAAVTGAANAVALGNGSNAGGVGSMALGAGAATAIDNNVALGSNSVAGAADGGWAGTTIGGTTIATNTLTANAVLGISGGGTNRQIQGVADGAVNATSTDAINGSQLFYSIQALNTAIAPPLAADNVNNLPGPNVIAGQNGVAIGYGATSSGTNSVALGNGSTDGGRANVVSAGSAGATRQLINVGAGTLPTDAVNVSQLLPLVTALGGGSTINTTTRRGHGGRPTMSVERHTMMWAPRSAPRTGCRCSTHPMQPAIRPTAWC